MSTSPTSRSPDPAAPRVRSKRSGGATRAEQIRLIGAVLLGALLVLFAVLNLDDVKVNWILSTWTTPLILVIAVSFVVGAIIGLILGRRTKQTA